MKEQCTFNGDMLRSLLLPFRRLVVVTNMRAAQSRLRDWIASCPARKLRQVQFDDTHLELSDYDGTVVDCAVAQLKQANLFVKKVKWKLHPALRDSD